jgi:hypothetical protein
MGGFFIGVEYPEIKIIVKRQRCNMLFIMRNYFNEF